MGSVNDEQKKYFTAVLRGMLNLGNAKFRYGCTGVNLDYLARSPLWEMGQDFNHGTGDVYKRQEQKADVRTVSGIKITVKRIYGV